MKPQYYFSRNFVEFGAFTAEEITDFGKRGILADTDYVRNVDTHHWETVSHWLAKHNVSAPAKPAKKATTARKKAAPTTKASKKAA